MEPNRELGQLGLMKGRTGERCRPRSFEKKMATSRSIHVHLLWLLVASLFLSYTLTPKSKPLSLVNLGYTYTYGNVFALKIM